MKVAEATPVGAGRGHRDANTSGDVHPVHSADAYRDQLHHPDLDDQALDYRGLLHPPVRGRSPLYQAWVERARTTRIEDVVAKRGLKLRRQGRQGALVGPCPRCGGNDRFSCNTKKSFFNCRGCGGKGDVIALVRHLDNCDFLSACEALTGEPPPRGTAHGREQDRARDHAPSPDPAAAERVRAENAERAERLATARRIWSLRVAPGGTILETYLRTRGYRGAIPATLGFLPASDGYPPAPIAAHGIAREIEPGVLAIDDAAVTGVQLIRLLPNGSDRERVPGAKIRIGLGVTEPVMLAPPNDLLGLVVTEGIEDALVAHQATGLGAWASGGAGFLAKLAAHVPNYIEAATIIVDDNEAGRTGSAELAERLDARGIEVVLDGALP